eukprot:10669719-Ditylum_brightwellii.AAC.1
MLLQVMMRRAHVDNNMCVKSMYTDEVWNDSSTFPSEEKINEEFQIQRETLEEGYVTMIMYAKIIHQKAWREIQQSESVMLYQRKSCVFMFIDQFNTRKVGTLGFVTQVHPKNHNIKKLREAIEYGLKVVDSDKEDTVIKWQESPSAETKLADIHDKGTHVQIKDREENILPKFVVYTG